jgi:hypothetical protein
MATRIQTLFRNYRISSLAGVTRRLLVSRKAVGYSEIGTELLTSLLHEDPGGGQGISGPSCHYRSPGFRQNTPQFQSVLNQHTLYCNRFFTSSDAVLLGAVLRHPLCRTRRLVLHAVNGTNPSFEFDLLSAVAQCRSLRVVALLGGVWSGGFLSRLYQLVQLEHPLIQTVLVEACHGLKSQELDQILSAASSLLLDFFNYSVPGIRHLSLHGLNLVDGDMILLAKGLVVNTSLTHLSLSLNLIEEEGFQVIFAAVASCSKSALVSLDFSWNLVSLTDSVVRLFDGFRRSSPSSQLQPHPGIGRRPLSVNLIHNRISSPPSNLRRDDDLIVRTVEESKREEEEEQVREGRRGDPKRRRHAQTRSGTAPTPPGRSKFKSSLLRDLQSQQPLVSQTMRL